MSSGNKDDLSNTKSVAKSVMPKVSRGKTWLGHFENKQSGLIDLLILEGVCSAREISMKVERAFPGVTNAAKRVESHIKHLQSGESRGRSRGMEPHYLKIVTDAAGKIHFDIK